MSHHAMGYAHGNGNGNGYGNGNGNGEYGQLSDSQDYAQAGASWQPTQTQCSPPVQESQEVSSTFVNPKSKYCEY